MGEIFVWLKVGKMRICKMAIKDTTPSTKVHTYKEKNEQQAGKIKVKQEWPIPALTFYPAPPLTFLVFFYAYQYLEQRESQIPLVYSGGLGSFELSGALFHQM